MSTSSIDDQLEATALRIAEAVARGREPHSRADEQAWLAACAERERALDATLDEAAWPLVRLGLSPTEMRVLWVLLVQELDPAARVNLRELATEDEVDVGYDVLRRVVYGSRPTRDAWRELSEQGRLRRSCLIDIVDDSQVPTHRLTFRISQRVLAILHGDDANDGELVGVVPCTGTTRSDELVVDASVQERVRTAVARREPGMVLVIGPDGSGRRSLVAATARARRRCDRGRPARAGRSPRGAGTPAAHPRARVRAGSAGPAAPESRRAPRQR